VYVVSFPEIRGKQQVSTDRGRRPVWSASGDELFFWNGDTLMVAPVSIGALFEAETPRPLFVLPGMRRGYDVSADGQRFLVHLRNPDAPAREIHVVENWLEVLKGKGGNE
jgi:coproporphyrinogen III oxidase